VVAPRSCRLRISGNGAGYLAYPGAARAWDEAIQALAPGENLVVTFKALSDGDGAWSMRIGESEMRAVYRLDAEQVRQSPQESPQATLPEGRLWLGSLETPPVKVRTERSSQMFLAINRIFSEWVWDTQTALATKRMRALPFLPAQRVLLRMLHDSRYQKGRVIWALGVLGSQAAVGDLLALLEDKSQYTDTIVWSLGEIRDPQAIEPLCRLLSANPVQHAYNRVLVKGVIEALLKIKDKRAAVAIEPYVHDSDPFVSAQAMTALQVTTGEDWSARLISHLFPRDTDPDNPTGPETGYHWARLAQMGELPFAAALSEFEKARDEQRVAQLGRLLRRIHDQGYHRDRIVSAFVAKARATNPAVRRQTIALSEGIARDDISQMLIRLLRDESDDVRAAAADALAELKPPQAVAPLLRMMRNHSRRSGQAAVTALGAFKDPRIETAVMKEYWRGDFVFRSACIGVADGFVSRRTRAWLSAIARKDPEPSLRQDAADALRRLGEARRTRRP
jgi:HEAT repeat protein